ncbi:porin [Faecalibacter bovis]|uniref:Porin n=1 Tax=Faecalibacter bovis TaxID=2898187 RepID=A0ABX7XED8_9FLAO|nr:porin [Faecalibacter bovis]QTV06283.1 porin [Faecalibacter bovis]
MKKSLLYTGFLLLSINIFGQETNDTILKNNTTNQEENLIDDEPKFKHSLGDLNIKLDDTGDRYLKFGLNSQVWLRSIENNPGTLVNGVEQKNTYDAGLRRMRVTMQAQLSPAYQIYVQLGINNQSFIAGGGSGTGANGQGKKPAIFFMDAYNELAIIPQKDFKTKQTNNFNLYLGAGLHGFNGISRMSNASTGKILMADMPIFNYPNIENSDQFARQLGIFARGEYDKFNYRFAVNKPFATNLQPQIGQTVDNNQSGKLSYSGYLMYNFFDKESGSTAFLPGFYLGTKKVVNVGVGFYSSKEGALSQPELGVYKSHDHSVLSADIFADLPVGIKSKEMAINLYSVFYRYNFGPNYLRNLGIMNPGTLDPNYPGTVAMEGVGNARNLLGTGNIWFTQVGFLLPKFSETVKLQPFASYTLKDLEGLNEQGSYYDIGANLFVFSQSAKISYQYSSRPLYDPVNKKQFDRKGEHILMFQLAF